MNKATKFLISIVGCELVGLITTPITIAAIPTWYAGLEKPFFSPPNWIFGPVWTLLYFLMGFALYLIWTTKGTKKEKLTALSYFAIQLFLNLIWSPIFFGLQSPVLALVVIILLLFFIARTMQAFAKVSQTATLLLIPYLLWVCFATLLNTAIVFLNP